MVKYVLRILNLNFISNKRSEYVFYYGENKKIDGYKDLNVAVQDGSAEIGLQAQTMTPEQFSQIDFSEPLITIP